MSRLQPNSQTKLWLAEFACGLRNLVCLCVGGGSPGLSVPLSHCGGSVTLVVSGDAGNMAGRLASFIVFTLIFIVLFVCFSTFFPCVSFSLPATVFLISFSWVDCETLCWAIHDRAYIIVLWDCINYRRVQVAGMGRRAYLECTETTHINNIIRDSLFSSELNHAEIHLTVLV